jgi:hypothetical protein
MSSGKKESRLLMDQIGLVRKEGGKEYCCSKIWTT